MFDENSGIWIRIYKGIVIALLFVRLVGGFVVGSITHSKGLAYLGCVVAGLGIGFIQYIFGMLAVNFFANVQKIRETIVKK